jgi:hypothetical protein
MSEEAGAATVTMSWSWTASQYGAMVAVPVKPAIYDYYYTSASVLPTAVKDGATPLTKVDTLLELVADTWFWDDDNDRLYVQVTGGGNPGTLTIDCSAVMPVKTGHYINAFLKGVGNGIRRIFTGKHGGGHTDWAIY